MKKANHVKYFPVIWCHAIFGVEKTAGNRGYFWLFLATAPTAPGYPYNCSTAGGYPEPYLTLCVP